MIILVLVIIDLLILFGFQIYIQIINPNIATGCLFILYTVEFFLVYCVTVALLFVVLYYTTKTKL